MSYTNESLARDLYNFCLTAAGLDINGTNAYDAETNNALTYCIDGAFYSKAAITTVDLSATTYATGGSLVIADDETAEVYCLINSAGTVSTYLLRSTETWAPADGTLVFGKIVILNESGSDFTVGTTELSTSGVTDTYVDICRFKDYIGRSGSTGTLTY